MTLPHGSHNNGMKIYRENKKNGGCMQKKIMDRISQYRETGKNFFSYTEKVLVAIMCPDLYNDMMPCEYRDRPMVAFFKVLDTAQRAVVIAHYESI